MVLDSWAVIECLTIVSRGGGGWVVVTASSLGPRGHTGRCFATPSAVRDGLVLSGTARALRWVVQPLGWSLAGVSQCTGTSGGILPVWPMGICSRAARSTDVEGHSSQAALVEVLNSRGRDGHDTYGWAYTCSSWVGGPPFWTLSSQLPYRHSLVETAEEKMWVRDSC